jgi:ferric-dicitrate binding protein FerR (iron transport regulator)
MTNPKISDAVLEAAKSFYDARTNLWRKTMKLPEDFDLSEARCPAFSKHTTPSRRWILEQASLHAAMLEGLPCSAARLILEDADRMVSRVADRAATSTEFRLDPGISHGELDDGSTSELEAQSKIDIKPIHDAMVAGWMAAGEIPEKVQVHESSEATPGRD